MNYDIKEEYFLKIKKYLDFLKNGVVQYVILLAITKLSPMMAYSRKIFTVY